tara:strand:+ start:516 stop:848 length:333 start_codon:yes stop_codon:yes gene_type:complete
MQKFLSIPVAGSTPQLVAVSGIILIEQLNPGGGTNSSITITYGNAAAQDVVTITLGSEQAANDVSVRDRIQESVIDALQLSWHKPSLAVSLLGLVTPAGAAVTVTGIAIA